MKHPDAGESFFIDLAISLDLKLHKLYETIIAKG